MPSSVVVGGVNYYKPGVYGAVDASNAPGIGASFGNLAVVGAFPFLKNDTPVKVTSPQQLRALDPVNADLARLAKLCFEPCQAGQGIGGAAAVTLVSAQTVTQASRTLYDAGIPQGPNVPDAIPAKPSIKFAAKTWGFRGNQAWSSISTSGGNKRTIKFVQPGFAAEEFKDIESGTVVAIKCVSATAGLNGANDTVKASVSPTAWSIDWTKRLTASDPNNFNPDLRAGGEKVYIAISADTGGSRTFTVTGTKADGTPGTGTVTLNAGAEQNGMPKEVVNSVGGGEIKWSIIDSVTAPATANVATYDLSGSAIKLTTSQFSKLTDLAAQINNQSVYGFTADVKSAKAYQIPANEADKILPSVTIKDADCNVRADVWAIVQACSGSKICTVTRESGADTVPTASGAAYLGGGTESSVTVSTDYPDALSKIADADVQVVAVLESDVEAAKALAQHCTTAAVQFGRERNGWYGCAGGLAVDTADTGIAALVNKIYNRNVALVADKIQLAPTIAGGSAEWLDPKYLAVAMAAAQSGRPVGTPLTEKVFDVLDHSHLWADGADENLVIAAGICALYKNIRGVSACLRSVTTNNDNTFYSEVSTNESINTSIRLLRVGLKKLIGQPITESLSPSVIKQLAISLLEEQVANSYIKAFKNVVVQLQGDTYSIDYELAPVQPLNFIMVTAHLGQF